MTLEDILKDTDRCFKIASSRWRKYWHRKNLDKIMAVTQDPATNYFAGLDWNEERFSPYAEQIIEGVTRDSYWSYMSGCLWKDERFDRAAERIINAILPTEDFSRAYNDWLPERVKTIEEYFIKKHPCLQNRIEQIEPVYKPRFWQFAEKIGGELMQKVPIEDFYNAAEAYEFALQKDNVDLFYKGLKESAEKGSVGKWAKIIIQHFRESSIGAGSYRFLEVAA